LQINDIDNFFYLVVFSKVRPKSSVVSKKLMQLILKRQWTFSKTFLPMSMYEWKLSIMYIGILWTSYIPERLRVLAIRSKCSSFLQLQGNENLIHV